MKRLIAFLLTIVFLTCAHTAFAESAAVLEHAQWSTGEDIEFIQKHQLTATKEWLSGNGGSLEDLENLGDAGYETDAVSEKITDEALQEAGLNVLSVSPDGQTILLEKDGSLLLMRGNQLSTVSMDLTRCEPSEQEGLLLACRFVSEQVLQDEGIGRAGILWSPDGKYALISNATSSLMRMKNSFGLLWLDAEHSEMYMASPGSLSFGFGRGDTGTIVMHKCADTADGYVYGTIYGNLNGGSGLQICRWAPGAAEHETLGMTDAVFCCEGMGFDAEHHLCMLVQADGDRRLLEWSPESGISMGEVIPDYLLPQYLEVTPLCTILSTVKNDETNLPVQYIRKDGNFSRLIVEKGQNTARIEPLEADTPPKEEGLTILNAVLTSDGGQAMLCCRDEDGSYCFYLMDTDSFELTEMDASPIQELLDQDPCFAFEKNRRPCFTGGDRYYLIPFQDGNTVLCDVLQ